MKNKVLIITSSGGGGLLQAAIAKEQELRSIDPTVVIVKRDVLVDWYWKIIGKFAIFAWNHAQKWGNVSTLESLLRMQRAADPLFYFRILFRALNTLFSENVSQIIDTQPLGTKAILHAIRFYNWKKGKNVLLEKVIVDLPTPLNTHFFHSLKKLSPKSRSLLRLITIPPLLKANETESEFWKEHCNISKEQVRYEYYPIRLAFRRFHNQKVDRNQPYTVRAKIKADDEWEYLTRALALGNMQYEVKNQDIEFKIKPNAFVTAILLGSQPAYRATIQYVDELLKIAKESPATQQRVIFVFCGFHTPGKRSLLIQLVQHIESIVDYPTHTTVIPLSFQSDETVSTVFHRCDLTCTRSGGQTAMELMCVSSGEIWIHSETKNSHDNEKLLKGIPGWESGNAVYLQRMREAKIVSPEIIFRS